MNGKKLVQKPYEKMFELIYEDNLTVTKAARIAKEYFPLFHQINVKNNYQYKEKDKRKQHGTIKKLREIMAKGKLIHQFDYNNATIYIYDKRKQLKRTQEVSSVKIIDGERINTTKLVHTYSHEYLITTTTEILKGMFFNSATFGRKVKIANFTPLDSETLCQYMTTQRSLYFCF